MAKKSPLSSVVDQLGDLLTQIQDNKEPLLNSQPVKETLDALEQQLKIFQEYAQSLPKRESSSEDKKPLEKLEKITSDAEHYQKAIDEALTKAKNDGKIKETETEKKRKVQKRKKKFDALKKL